MVGPLMRTLQMAVVDLANAYVVQIVMLVSSR